jgi:hypothetical protein
VARNLGETCLALGDLQSALKIGRLGTEYANEAKGDGKFIRAALASIRANSLHQLGNKDAPATFEEAERLWRDYGEDEGQPYSFSLHGFHRCELLLGTKNHELAWELANERLSRIELTPPLLSRALAFLARGRSQIVRAAAQGDRLPGAADQDINEALKLIRTSNRLDYLPNALLSRACLRSFTGAHTGPDSAQEDLDEAWEIAERGPMKLFLADIHLHRARLFFREKEYPWNKNPDGTARGPKDDLDAAEKLISSCGYHRRDEELADAKRAILETA